MFDFEQAAYKDLRNRVAERTDRLLAWVGAGLSVSAGLPTWDGLKASLMKDLDKKGGTLDARGAEMVRAKCTIAAYESNPWTAFEVLKEGLGGATYVAAVRSALDPAAGARVPGAYMKLWQLRLGGVLNLNLDKFATRAFNSINPGANLSEFVGRFAGEYVYLLQSANPFVANLHGTTDLASSWVFTKSELRSLLQDEGYTAFITACLASRTVLFVGITADDLATGGHLTRLRETGVDLGNHFWITPRQDLQTDQWAESAGIRVIRYNAPKHDHRELDDALEDLISYVPKEVLPPPVTPSPTLFTPLQIPGPLELQKLDAETIRRILNSRASEILSSSSVDREEQYAEFRKVYRVAIYRAWDVTAEDPDNVLFGYKIISPIAAGAFGQVYRAESPMGEEVAIKVLHGEIRSNIEMLQSFRRGVNSMRILSKNKILGMVAYREASEIPACAIMEVVEGPNLVEAVTTKAVKGWKAVLRISMDLANILRRAHHLPERVLHRDVKPANIMLKGFYTDPQWEVVVLDFDLSWHRDAMGLSVDTSKSMSGFLAPEQVDASLHASTRNALVDSFGAGMTFFYLRSGKEPMFAQQKHADWRDKLTTEICCHQCIEWKSLPRRFARLIENSTRHKQSDRWDMSQISGELTQLVQACDDPLKVVSAEMLAEELAARSDMGPAYGWNQDSLEASLELPTGVRIAVCGDESRRQVQVNISWIDKGFSDRKKIGKWIPTACDQACSMLRSAGFNAEILSKTSTDTRVRASTGAATMASQINNASLALSNAIEAFGFE